MNTAETVCHAMRSSIHCHDLGNGDVAVNTQCLYPSNAVVQVMVRMVNGSFHVSDDGGAIREALTAGVELSKSAQANYAHVAKKQGLHFFGGAVSAPYVPQSAVAPAVMLVANASKEIADSIFAHYKIKRTRDFRALVSDLIKRELHHQPQEDLISGQSTRTYKFENVFTLPSGKRAIVDPVLHDGNSINARVIANLDVRAASDERVVQRIVYDDEKRWESDELNVLHMTNVKIIPFSAANTALKELLSA